MQAFMGKTDESSRERIGLCAGRRQFHLLSILVNVGQCGQQFAKRAEAAALALPFE
jgi:hypothetical protein